MTRQHAGRHRAVRSGRASMRGAMLAKTATHSAIGTNARPALTGEKPRVCCRYSEVKK